MCIDPVTLTIASTAITAAGTVVGGISAHQASQAEAGRIGQQAAYRETKAAYDIDAASRNQRRSLGRVTAEIGKSGVDAASFLDVISDDLAEGALERETIRFGGQVDSANMRTSARQVRQGGRMALLGSAFSAAGSAAAGYGRVATAPTASSNWVTTVHRG